MTMRKLLLTLSIVLGCGLIIGGIVNAQQAPKAPEKPKAPKAEVSKSDFDFDLDFDFDADFEFDQDMPTWQGDRNFTFFLQGGTFLGVHAEDVNKENMSTYGMGDVRGVGVTDIVKDSPAEKAGLRKGDVILAFNGEPVTSTRKLTRLVGESSPDQTARLTISRGGSQQEVSVTLAKRNPMNVFNGKLLREDIKEKVEKMKREMPQVRSGNGTYIFSTGSYRRIGISTQTLTPQLAEYFGVKEGVLVTSVVENSAAAKAGLKAGDIITAIDGEQVDGPGDLTRAINKKQDGPVLLTVVRNRSTISVPVTPEKPPAGSGDVRTIVMPEITIPAIPMINIQTPRIVVPQVDVTIPTVVRSRVII